MRSTITLFNANYDCIDMTHELNESTPSWDLGCGFKMYSNSPDCQEPNQFLIQTLELPAGIGTHIDAPSHACQGALSVSALSLSSLILPCFRIDVSQNANAHYQIHSADILAYEKRFASISPGSLVIFYTGWERFWGQPQQYRNELKFPSLSSQAAQLLLDRDIAGLAIDTLSPDCDGSGFPVHRMLLGAGKYIIENIANASLLPATGACCLVMPLKINGSEAPVRLIGLIPHRPN